MKISINEILTNMPKQLSDIEKVRYIYIQIANIFSYQRDFLYATDDRAIKDMYNDIITLDMIENGNYQNKIISTCKQTAEVENATINLLNNKNIRSRVVGYDGIEETHVAVVVNINGKNYYLDISLDLYKIQKGMRTKGFAKSDKALDGTKCEIISDEELENIDKKVGYFKYGIYMDEAIQLLRKEMLDEKRLEKYIHEYDNEGYVKEDIIYKCKIDCIFNYLKNNLSEKEKMGSIEINKYYQALFKRLLTKEEMIKNKINVFDIYLKSENKNKEESIIYIIKMRDRVLYYLYRNEDRGFSEINLEELMNMYKNGELECLDKYLEDELNEKEELR